MSAIESLLITWISRGKKNLSQFVTHIVVLVDPTPCTCTYNFISYGRITRRPCMCAHNFIHFIFSDERRFNLHHKVWTPIDINRLVMLASACTEREYIITGFRKGFRLGVDNTFTRSKRENVSRASPPLMDKLQEEIQKHRIIWPLRKKAISRSTDLPPACNTQARK